MASDDQTVLQSAVGAGRIELADRLPSQNRIPSQLPGFSSHIYTTINGLVDLLGRQLLYSIVFSCRTCLMVKYSVGRTQSLEQR